MAEKVEIIITADDRASKVIGGLRGSLSGLGNLAGGALKVGLLHAAAGFAGLGAGLAASVHEAMQSEEAVTKLDAVLKATGASARFSKDAILKHATALQSVTRFSDEMVVSAQSVLLQFRSISQEAFPRATETALNLATSLGVDATSAARVLGKALETPGEGLLRLKAAGVAFTDAQEKQIKAMVKAGNIAGAQKLILDELEKSTGGAARAAGTTFAGQLAILQNQFSDIIEEIGGAFLPILRELATFINTHVMPTIKAWAADAVPKVTAVLMELGKRIQTSVLPVLAQLGQWIIENVLPVMQQLGAFITEVVLPALQQFGDWLKGDGSTAVSGWGAAIADVWSKIAPILRAVFNELAKFWKEIQPKLAKAWDNISTQARAVWDAIWQIIQPIVVGIQEFIAAHMDEIQALWNAAWKQIEGFVKVVWASISGFIKIVLDLLGGDMEAAGKSWEAMQQGIHDGIKLIIQGAWEIIKTIVSAALRAILGAVTAKLNEMRGNIYAIFNAILGWLGSLPTSFATVGTNMLTALYNAIYAVAVTLTSMIIAPLRAAIDWITTTNWTALGTNLMASLRSGIAGWAASVLSALKSPFESGYHAIAGINWSGLAWSIGNAIWTVLRSWTDAIFRALWDPFNNAIAAIKRLLGIASPSRLMKKIGEQMTAGLVQGFAAPQLNMALAGTTAGAGLGLARETVSLRGPHVEPAHGGLTFVYAPMISTADEREATSKLRPVLDRWWLDAQRRRI